MTRIIYLILITILTSTELNALCPNYAKSRHSLYIGPEVYYLKRKKEGGSEQSGWLFGGSALYERRRATGFYWALDGYAAHGQIAGKTPSGKRLKSDLTDVQIDGRLGYSFCFHKCNKLTFIPYGGYGYLYSKNDFKKPSPIPCEFHNRIHYALAGFITSIRLTPCFDAEVNFTAKFMVEGKSKVKGDPQYDDVTTAMGNKNQYEVEIPLQYKTCLWGRNIIARFVPFYRFRHYGGSFNYPFDFIDTKFHTYGATLFIRLCF
ncbi:MAG: hypothetical protein K940chlam7_01242 [Chlamydiae bacterium]|nr:hypothetical protein [Chlamydiota bacterium]